MPRPDRGNAIDHVAVLMFENRSFDNLLGCLYQPGEAAAFAGVLRRELSNPIPAWAEHGAYREVIEYGLARKVDTPDPDPGEEYQHVNTQLFGVIDPAANLGTLAAKMAAPYNAPGPGQWPTMGGFIADYISAFTAETCRQPSYDEYAQVMSGYTPEQMPVLSGLARGFATFDHWFCEVPSQTFTNRSFFHAATASGYVTNICPPDSFPLRNTAETIFNRLELKGLTWKVYCEPPAHLSLTALIHAARLKHRFATHFVTTDQFLQDAANGELPTYSFIEPCLLHGHNVMHPPENALFPGIAPDLPCSLVAGEALMARIYNAVRSSSSPAGSNVYNTLLMINFGEHGGTYDHVPPPAVLPPVPSGPAGQYGFTFDRSGIRVPAIAISPWIPERTVISDEYRHTSLIRTLRERWSLGAPFTARDAIARDLAPVLSAKAPRAPEDWPEVIARPVPPFGQPVLGLDKPLTTLHKGAIFALLALGRDVGYCVPDVPLDTPVTGAQAMTLLGDLFERVFPNLTPM